MGSGDRSLRRNESMRTREVVISTPYYLADTPVTRGQWISAMGTEPWLDDDPDGGRPEHPATHVSHFDATEYCERMAASTRLKYRLPTEAEWEYACKAGSDTEYFFGDDESELSDYAWFKDNSNGDTHPVATKMPNSWGLYDMHGLVLEWCWDDWSYRQSDQTIDPRVINDDLRNVVKGGSWIARDFRCVPYYRYGIHGDWCLAHVGFRPVLEASGVAKILRMRAAKNPKAAAIAS